MTIDEIAALAGGVNRLAFIAGVHQTTVSASWRRAGRVPVDRCRTISEALGIPLHELRPDVWRPVNNDAPAHNSSEIAD